MCGPATKYLEGSGSPATCYKYDTPMKMVRSHCKEIKCWAVTKEVVQAIAVIINPKYISAYTVNKKKDD